MQLTMYRLSSFLGAVLLLAGCQESLEQKKQTHKVMEVEPAPTRLEITDTDQGEKPGWITVKWSSVVRFCYDRDSKNCRKHSRHAKRSVEFTISDKLILKENSPVYYAKLELPGNLVITLIVKSVGITPEYLTITGDMQGNWNHDFRRSRTDQLVFGSGFSSIGSEQPSRWQHLDNSFGFDKKRKCEYEYRVENRIDLVQQHPPTTDLATLPNLLNPMTQKEAQARQALDIQSTVTIRGPHFFSPQVAGVRRGCRAEKRR